MRFLEKLLLFIFSLLLVVFGAGFIYTAFARNTVRNGIESFLAGGSIVGWYLLFAGAFLVIVGVVIFITVCCHSDRKSSGNSRAVAANVAGGSINISAAAIDAIIKEASRKVDCIESITANLHDTAEGLHVNTKISVKANTNIIEVAEALKVVVKEQLETTAGLKIAKVTVLVTEISQSGASI